MTAAVDPQAAALEATVPPPLPPTTGCPPDCPAHVAVAGAYAGPARAARDCPVTAAKGAWGWPCPPLQIRTDGEVAR